MLTFFNEPYTVLKFVSGGGFTDDVVAEPVPVVRESIEALLNIQPLSSDKQYAMAPAMQGRTFNKGIVVYSEKPLSIAGDGNSNGDVVIFNNDNYLIVSGSHWVNRFFPISHHKYIALNCEVDKFELK